MPTTEQIVGRVGQLIGAPTCGVRTVGIPSELSGWQFRAGRVLEVGIAHGSLAVPDAIETRRLERRAEDKNGARHALLLALYDLCWGGDAQWLMSTSQEYAFFSHDHGWCLPPEGPEWNTAQLAASVDTPHELADPHAGAGLDKEAISTVSNRLVALKQEELVETLSKIPTSWPVSDDELEAVGHFLLHRAPQVAKRMRDRYLGA